jgi:hypothetical protein
MAAITTRETGTTGTNGVTRKNAPLTNSEIDTNFVNLNDNKLEASAFASYTGTTSVVTLGTVTTGTWSATTIATTRGGTGLTSFTNGGAVYATSTSALTTGTLPIASGGTGTTTAPTNGQLHIGNSSGAWAVASLTGSANRITITNGSGSITIATPQDIGTGSNPQFGSIGIGTAASGTAGEIRATNQITSYYSDERLKENVVEIKDALEKVMQLRGVTYNANQLAESFGFINKQKQVGVLAADVERVLPEAVKPAPFDIMLFESTEISKSGENYKTVQYERLVPLLIEAIKELNKEIKQLKGIN